MNRILFPSIRDLSTVPPVINAINYLSTFENVSVFSYHLDKTQFNKTVNFNCISSDEYPQRKSQRIVAKFKSWFFFYLFLIKNAREFDYIWLGVWDYALIKPVLAISSFKGKLIYQLHELEFVKFKYCRKVDHVIVPDENRGWIAYFLGNLKTKPLVLPNIPFFSSQLFFEKDTEINKIKSQFLDKRLKIMLYQGHIDYKKRCIKELLLAITKLPEYIKLVIMPGNYDSKIILKQIHSDIDELNLKNRVFVIDSVRAPKHLLTVQHADLGIGLYRPTSLNQIYAAPNRLYEFTKFGIPVILPNFPYFKSLSVKYPFAINTVNPECIEDIAKKILTVLNEPNYDEGCKNAQKFTNSEGNYEIVFSECWNKIINN